MDRCRKAFQMERMFGKGLAFGTILTCLGTRSKSKCLTLNTQWAGIRPGRGQKEAGGVIYCTWGLVFQEGPLYFVLETTGARRDRHTETGFNLCP